MKNYVSKIQELEGELHRLQRLNNSRRTVSDGYLGLDYDDFHSKGSSSAESDTRSTDVNGKYVMNYT